MLAYLHTYVQHAYNTMTSKANHFMRNDLLRTEFMLNGTRAILKTMLKTKLNNKQAMKYGLMNYDTLED
jgi:gluconate kinase